MSARGRAPLLAVHATLLLSVATLILTADVAAPWRAGWLAVAAAPLLAALPGLLALRRYTLQWLSIALVVYITVALMEVIAAGARLHPATLLLLAAALELGLILRMVRRR